MHFSIEVVHPGNTLEDMLKIAYFCSVAACVDVIRKVTKDQLRKDMLAFMGDNPGTDRDAENARADYLKNQYQPSLEALQVEDLTTYVTNLKNLALMLEFDTCTSVGRLSVSLRDDDLTDVVEVYYGAQAFTLVQSAGGSIRRDVYTKRGTNKQYVKDDLGVMTRRYGYRSMRRTQYSRLRMEGSISGRKGLFDAVSTNVKNNHALDHDVPTLAEAIYIHQRYGSGEEQRGVCLTSTPHNIVSDRGYQFGGENPVRIAVDLALIPTDVRFYNLYQNPRAWIGLPFLRFVKVNKPRKLVSDAQETRKGLLLSMLKNTELYVERLDMECVVMAHLFGDTTWGLMLKNITPRATDPTDPIEDPVINVGEDD